MTFSEELKNFILKKGAKEVGFADISKITPINDLNAGIIFYIPHKIENIKTIVNKPTDKYLQSLRKLNSELDSIAIETEQYLREKGFKAYSQTTSNVRENLINNSSELPHKTIATMAGLGWIGKSALFVTEKYGSAIRLSSVLTDAPLKFGNSIISSFCKDCEICQKSCPAGAITGLSWNNALKRDDLFNHELCEKKARELCLKSYGKEDTICGICIKVCPYTKRYLNSK